MCIGKKLMYSIPAAIVRNDTIYVLPRCEDNPAAALGGRTSRIGLSYSLDGIHFTSFDKPVLYPAPGSIQLNMIILVVVKIPVLYKQKKDLYVLAYTSWNYKVPRLSIAFSNDLFHWEKKGPAFAKAYNQRFLDTASKSASMITKMVDDKPVLAKMNGKYWMYWGERFVNLAWSENLYDWYPLTDSAGFLKKTLITRPNHFDSDLDECGPPALITDKGILLIYNGKNANGKNADPSLPLGTYSVGSVLFDSTDMETVIQPTRYSLPETHPSI